MNVSITTLLDLAVLILFAVAAAWSVWSFSPALGLALAGVVVLIGGALADQLKGGG